MSFTEYNNFYFAGIGGIGMSGLAQLLLADGKTVHGSDIAESEMVKRLREQNVVITLEQDGSAVQDVDVLVYSDALPEDHPERVAARDAGIPTLSYFEAVGKYAKQFKNVIAISGTHGKSTTTAMTAKVFLDAGRKPTVLVGSILPEQQTNVVAGEKELFIVEACEHNAHMLNIVPTTAVITNIEADHLDFYRDLEHIEETFAKWRESAQTIIENIPTEKFTLQVPGEHNQMNATLAAAVARAYGIDDEVIRKGLESYAGLWRRFEVKGEHAQKKGVTVVSDYAHHPTEIAATIQAAQEHYPNSCIFVVFQPHQRKRTQALLNEFVESLIPASASIVQEVYDVAGREEGIAVSSTDIVAGVKKSNPNCHYSADQEETLKLLEQHLSFDDVLLIMGAGDIYTLADKLV